MAAGLVLTAGHSPRVAAGEKITAYVSIRPQGYFVQKVGGDLVEVKTLISPGQSHETFDPTPRTLADLAGADIYFTMGLPFEKNLSAKIAATMPNLVRGDLLKNITLLKSPLHGHHDHDIDHGEYDTHVWMDPGRVKTMAANIADCLGRLDTLHRENYQANARAFQIELDVISGTISERLAPYEGKTFYVFHPAFGYFAESFGLKQAAVEFEGKEPSARQLAELVDRIKNEKITTIFIQPQFSRKGADTIARELGVKIEIMDPLEYNYLDNLAYIAEALVASFKGSEAGPNE